MARAELGTKRLCGACSAKFYDLGKDPIICPKCEEVFVPEPVVQSRRAPAPAPAPVAVAPVAAVVPAEAEEKDEVAEAR